MSVIDFVIMIIVTTFIASVIGILVGLVFGDTWGMYVTGYFVGVISQNWKYKFFTNN